MTTQPAITAMTNPTPTLGGKPKTTEVWYFMAMNKALPMSSATPAATVAHAVS